MPTLHWWIGASSVSPYVINVAWWMPSNNYPSLIHCLRARFILIFAKLLFRCHCYDCYKNYYCYFCHRYRYFHTTLLLNTLLQILSLSGVVEFTTQLLILVNIIWPPLCWINKFGLNTLPSKTVAIPYTCGLSVATHFSWTDELPTEARGTCKEIRQFHIVTCQPLGSCPRRFPEWEWPRICHSSPSIVKFLQTLANHT